MCPVLVHIRLVRSYKVCVQYWCKVRLLGQTRYMSSNGARCACKVKQGMCPVLVQSWLVKSNMVCVQYWYTVHLLGQTRYVFSIGAKWAC